MIKHDHPPEPRRRFLRTLVYGSVLSGLGSTIFKETVHADIGVELTSSVGTLRIRLEDYPSLAQPTGSIRIGVNPLRSNHLPNGTFFPILINRLDDQELVCLSAECTHASCAVRPFSPRAKAHICPCHGSRFNLDGSRIGGPASSELERYDSEIVNEEILEIKVPRLGFNMNGCFEKTMSPCPLRLEFPARRGVTYQVIRKESMNASWMPSTFALEAGQPPTHTELKGDDSIRSVYVPEVGEQGFYAIEVKLFAL